MSAEHPCYPPPGGISAKKIQAAADPAQMEQELIRDYREKFANPYRSAELGYIDAVIDPEETRSKLIVALESLKNKTDTNPWRKHGNIPL